MSVAVRLTPSTSQGSESHTVTVYLPPSSSNRSYSILKRVGIGFLTLAGTAALAATIYFSVFNKASKESTSASNTTETSTGHNVFADCTEPSISESLQSLHNIVRLVQTGPDYYDNCASAFQAHWERFKECGASVDECMRNSIKLFGELFCKPPNSFGYIDDNSEKCENTYFALARCDI
ncbi:MAG TPA: hypothetical protein VGZ69_07650 [Candidatus Rhabdochlamydia sp.]|jgi:hypothetical protein|nr:hypothetical protein [Candidatus Rhabdochlamydia sp.]